MLDDKLHEKTLWSNSITICWYLTILTSIHKKPLAPVVGNLVNPSNEIDANSSSNSNWTSCWPQGYSHLKILKAFHCRNPGQDCWSPRDKFSAHTMNTEDALCGASIERNYFNGKVYSKLCLYVNKSKISLPVRFDDGNHKIEEN